MPTETKRTRRVRGRQRILLRRVIKVYNQVLQNNIRYPQPPLNRNNILTVETLIQLSAAAGKAIEQLEELWPPVD